MYPPDSNAPDGLAIQVDPEDHNKTMSKGSKPENVAYREKQRVLLQQGKLNEAIQMDIDDINKIAAQKGQPEKYKCAIQEMQEYIKKQDTS